VGPDGTPLVYDRVFIPGDRFRITRNIRYDRLTPTRTNGTTTNGTPVSNDALTDPIVPSEAVRMSACAKEPNRPTEVFHAQPL
jgi:hypothetical protein